MSETCCIELTITLPKDLAEQAIEVQRTDPEFLSRVVLYGLTRRSIYRHLHELEDAVSELEGDAGDDVRPIPEEAQRRILEENGVDIPARLERDTPAVGDLVSTRSGVKPETSGTILEIFPAGTHEGIDETAGPLATVGERLFAVSDLVKRPPADP